MVLILTEVGHCDFALSEVTLSNSVLALMKFGNPQANRIGNTMLTLTTWQFFTKVGHCDLRWSCASTYEDRGLRNAEIHC